MLRCATSTRVLYRATYTQLSRRSTLFLPSLRSAVHTGLASPSHPYNSAAHPGLDRHFWTIDTNKDREYLNGQCTTIKLPASQSLAGSSTSDSGSSNAGLQVEHVQKVSKIKLCHENGIQPRDLRALDTDMVPRRWHFYTLYIIYSPLWM